MGKNMLFTSCRGNFDNDQQFSVAEWCKIQTYKHIFHGSYKKHSHGNSDSLRPSGAQYMHQEIKSSLVQKMAHHLVSIKPLYTFLIESLWTKFSEIWFKIQQSSFKKMILKMSSAKYQPFCLRLNVLTRLPLVLHICISEMGQHWFR